MSQICVWPGTVVSDEDKPDFIEWMKDEFAVTATPLTSIETLPDLDNGEPVPETGGRVDFVFTVRDQDVPHFAVPRLALGVRWWDDYMDSDKDIVPADMATKVEELASESETDEGGA